MAKKSKKPEHKVLGVFIKAIMKEGEEYFKETIYHSFPTHAMVLKGEYATEEYKNLWWEIETALMITKRLRHPERHTFIWVNLSDCKFGVKKVFREIK